MSAGTFILQLLLTTTHQKMILRGMTILRRNGKITWYVANSGYHPTHFKVATLLAVLGAIGLVGQLLMLRAIYLRKSKRMTWTMRLININSFFALSYLILLTPIGKIPTVHFAPS